MIGQTTKIIALSFAIGLFAWFTPKKQVLDFSKYSTQGLTITYTVSQEHEVAESAPLNFPHVGRGFLGFKEALGFKESQGNYFVVNTYGYLGKYQFGKSTLDLLGIKDKTVFLNSPELQEKAFMLNTSRNKWVLRRDIKNFSDKWVGGIRITESGILAAAHLAGPGSVKKFLRSGGATVFRDGFGTTIESYLKKFSGYDVSVVEANKKAHI